MKQIILISSTVFIVIFLIAENILIKRIGNQLTMYSYNREFDKYDELRHKWFTLYLFKPFNLYFMDLNVAIFKGDRTAIDQCFSDLEKIRMSKKQKMLVYNRAFYYYVLIQEKEKAKRYYYLLCDGNEETVSKDILIFYNTFIEEGFTYLEEVQEMLKTCNPEQRADFESLLSKIYENKGESELSRKYQESAEMHFTEMEKAKNII